MDCLCIFVVVSSVFVIVSSDFLFFGGLWRFFHPASLIYFFHHFPVVAPSCLAGVVGSLPLVSVILLGDAVGPRPFSVPLGCGLFLWWKRLSIVVTFFLVFVACISFVLLSSLLLWTSCDVSSLSPFHSSSSRPDVSGPWVP